MSELERVRWWGRTRYHTALEQRIPRWRQRGIWVSRSQQEAELKTLRAEMAADSARHRQVLPDVLARLDTTYPACLRRVHTGEQPGFPRFHGKDRSHCFTDNESGNGARLANGSLVVSKLGRIAVRWSRPINGTRKTVTISKAADGWYVSCCGAEGPVEPLPRTGNQTGSDVGLTVFLSTAEGDPTEHPRHYRTAQRPLQNAQQRVSRRKKGSKRRAPAVHHCAKPHQHLRRQRGDVHHQTALGLVRPYDTISVAAIPTANLRRRPEPKPDGNGHSDHTGASRKAGLNQRIHDAGWRSFLSILADTAACAGKRGEAVSPAYTSQDGRGCGERIEKRLSVRTPVCTHCGLILDRDKNAARTIQWRGQRLRGRLRG